MKQIKADERLAFHDSWDRWRVTLAVLTLFAVLIVGDGVARGQLCTGDCDAGGAVTVDEILRGVNIALGTTALIECDSFDHDGDEMVTVDEILTAVNAALEGCLSPQTQAFVVVTNFTTGSFATISLDEPREVVPGSSKRDIHGDSVARWFNDRVYVVNRFQADTIQWIRPTDDFATEMRCLTGELTNPHDIAFVDADKAYVSLFDRPQILIVDPTPGPRCEGFVRGAIDISAYADADGLPESDLMRIVGRRLYVTLEKLDRDNFFVPSGPGSVLVVDVDSDTVVKEIPLTSGNPFSQSPGIVLDGNSLVISETNEFGRNDGGLERIDLSDETARGFFVTEATLGGDLTDFVLVDEHLGYAVISVSLEEITSELVRFDPTTGEKLGTVIRGGNYADIELNDRGELWVADSTSGAGGIRVFRARDGVELTLQPISVGLPPFFILFLP